MPNAKSPSNSALRVANSSGGWNRTNVFWFRARHSPAKLLRNNDYTDTRPSRRFGEKGSNLHLQVQSLPACRLADPRIKAERVGVEPTSPFGSPAFEAGAIASWLALPYQLGRQDSNLQPSA